MWALIKDNEIDHIIAHPKSMVIDGVRHPRAIFTIWSDADLKVIGIIPVTTSGSHLDSKYYIEKNEVFALAGDKNSVIRTIGEKAADRKLTDTNNVDENDDPVLDDHDNQVVTLGLKSQEINQVKRETNDLIKGFDWLTQRKVTADTDIPEVVITYIANVREKCEEICTAIMNVSTMDEFKVLFQDELNEDRTIKTVRKRQDFPDDYYVKGYRR